MRQVIICKRGIALMNEYKICRIGESGTVQLSPICLSPEAAARRDPEAFLAFYEECKRIAEKLRQDIRQLTLEMGESSFL